MGESAGIRPLQHHLEYIYGVSVPLNVEDFLITDPELARQLGDESPRETPERLLIAQDQDQVDIALYLDSELLERLGENDPLAALHDDNLGDFCTALEGVSHFLYLAWRASLSHSVRPLELEMQAEVDKFIAIALLLSRQYQGRVPTQLHHWLFERCHFDKALLDDEASRYRVANRYAAKYCHQLEQRYLRSEAPPQGLIGDLRAFYRLGLQDKIRRIEGTG